MSRLSRREFLVTGAAAPAIAQNKKKKVQEASWEPPNVVLIVADDLADWMCGCYGNKEFKTPNIDLLSQLGTRFSNSYVVSPASSPSRATLHTGRLPAQHGIHDFLTPQPVDEPPQGQAAPPDSFASEAMISDVLSEAGWRCGYVGKWHMGNDARPGHHYDFTYTLLPDSSGYQDPTMARNGETVREKGYLTDLTTKAAIEFLDQQKPAERFFLSINYLNPHPPYDGHPQKFYDMYADTTFETIGYQPAAPNALRGKEMLSDIAGNLRKCAASVSAMDAQIPTLLNKLRERQLRRNTLVIFTSDNGSLLGRHGLWSAGHASNPINMYEEVMRVPMIWVWPGEVPVQATRPELISFYDLFPSLVHAARAPLPQGRNLCGRSYISRAMGGQWKGEDAWPVYVYGTYRNVEMARDGRYKVVLRDRGEGPSELYHLIDDPRERRNRYDDPQFVAVRNRLSAKLADWRASYR